MTTLSIRLPDALLKDAEQRARDMDLPRSVYIRRAIESMNENVLMEQKRRRMMEISRRVRGESMRVNSEFDKIEVDVED